MEHQSSNLPGDNNTRKEDCEKSSDSDSDYDPTENEPTKSDFSASPTIIRASLFAKDQSTQHFTSETDPKKVTTTELAPSCTSREQQQKEEVNNLHYNDAYVENFTSSEKNSNNWLRLHTAKVGIRCIALTPSGSILCTGSEDGHLCMYDFTTELTSRQIAPTRTLTPFVNRIAGLQGIVALHSSIDNAFFVVCQDGDRPLVLKSTGKVLGLCAMGERGLMDVIRCKGHRASVTCSSAHTSHAAMFYTSSVDGTARLWDVNRFEIGSSYAVKHGSGQLDDNVVVECVTGLGHPSNSFLSWSVFATSGEDGCVQVWDHRVKYRPHGAMMTIDVYDLLNHHLEFHGNSNTIVKNTSNEFIEKHIGGLAELTLPTGTSMLAVRANEHLIGLDLRNATSSSSSSSTSSSHNNINKKVLMASFPHDLSTTPNCTSTPLVPRFTNSSRSVKDNYNKNCKSIANAPMENRQSCCNNNHHHVMTCTSRTGYEGVRGGHVLTIQPQLTDNVYHFVTQEAWQAGHPDEDVLCACVDNSRSDDGCIFAGLSSGDVVVSVDASCLHHDTFNFDSAKTNNNDQPIVKWLHSRPTAHDEADSRKAGQKFARPTSNAKNKVSSNKVKAGDDDDYDDDLNDILY